jgi:hypothetical protein
MMPLLTPRCHISIAMCEVWWSSNVFLVADLVKPVGFVDATSKWVVPSGSIGPHNVQRWEKFTGRKAELMTEELEASA